MWGVTRTTSHISYPLLPELRLQLVHLPCAGVVEYAWHGLLMVVDLGLRRHLLLGHALLTAECWIVVW